MEFARQFYAAWHWFYGVAVAVTVAAFFWRLIRGRLKLSDMKRYDLNHLGGRRDDRRGGGLSLTDLNASKPSEAAEHRPNEQPDPRRKVP